MQKYKKDFIDFMLQTKALQFGEFTLKSGRVSPYFFNAGSFNKSNHISKLGEFYAQAIENNNIEFDVLFGPAYKGIPLAISTAIALYNNFNKNIAYSFNRKEAKSHGEGGSIVGHSLEGDILIIDDVITAGTAIRESQEIIIKNNAKIKAVIVSLDRQERGKSDICAIQEIQQEFDIEIFSIISLADVITYLEEQQDIVVIEKINKYRNLYGV